jgi:hypothetical protein
MNIPFELYKNYIVSKDNNDFFIMNDNCRIVHRNIKSYQLACKIIDALILNSNKDQVETD